MGTDPGYRPETSIIFVNYRRSDAGWPADHLADKLKAAFGSARVFLDVRDIDAGEDFSDDIARHLDSAAVLIVLIGKQWLYAQDAVGRRRLDRPHDWVRKEIRACLARKDCRVIPVLLDDAQLPAEKDALPRDIASLVKRQRIGIRQATSLQDIERLIYEIEKAGFSRLADPAGLDSRTTTTGESVTLRVKKKKAAQTLAQLIKHGEALLEELHEDVPTSPETLDSKSRHWHRWRQLSEQSMRGLFSSAEPLRWLKELRPRHLDFQKPWEERSVELPRDIQNETRFLQNLLQRLDNYESLADHDG